MRAGSVASPPFRALGPVHPVLPYGPTLHKRGLRRHLHRQSLKTRPSFIPTLGIGKSGAFTTIHAEVKDMF